MIKEETARNSWPGKLKNIERVDRIKPDIIVALDRGRTSESLNEARGEKPCCSVRRHNGQPLACFSSMANKTRGAYRAVSCTVTQLPTHHALIAFAGLQRVLLPTRITTFFFMSNGKQRCSCSRAGGVDGGTRRTHRLTVSGVFSTEQQLAGGGKGTGV